MRILDFLVKEFRQVRRDKKLLPFLFIQPVLQLTIFGFAVSTDIKHLKTVICDLDRTPESRELTRAVTTSEYFDYVGSVQDTREIARFLDTGRASVALVVERGYEKDVKQGNTARAQAILDGSDPNTGTVAVGYLGKIIQARAGQLMEARTARGGQRALLQVGVEPRLRVWYNPNLESKNYMVPGVMCVIVGMVTMILTALAIVKEREIGTMEQLIVTPVRPWELMLGKMLPYLVIGYIDIVLILLAGTLIFHVPIRGSLPLLFGMAGLFILCSLGIGLLISTISQTQQQAMMATIFFLFPNILISGFIFPIENMPLVMQWITYVLPMRYFLIITRDLFLKGSGIALLWNQAIPLAILAVSIFTLATLRFHKRLD